MQTNYTILVWANKSKKNSENKAPIYGRLTVNGRRAEISLNEKIDLKLWDAKFHKVKGSTNIARRINLKIDKAISKLNTICEDIIREGELLTPSLAKSKYLGNHIKHETLDQLIEYHQEKMANFLKPGTLKNYYTTRKYLDKYIKEKLKTSDIYIKQVNYKFMIDFEDYLRNQKGLNNNGVMKHLERLKKLMNLAEDLEWIKKNPVKRYKLRFEEVNTDYLTKEELSKLINTEFKKTTLKQVKDVFLLIGLL
ncbi:phage integrase SAM-like domain and Arm DNA-binding domain-containing protein [Psychroflexus aestuariivivens]|uniref:phage integrase SAM-like domain and Arm DNA-binding domain-containing protein n=1 Tax=Psychroflexus aestuariivivens TaxID=1795040 RepID=UPI001F0066FB|nr:phage integrase SAM-like domain and Arm DNA-binding domain-containing protein [Psychroflexus aestuariivivens]